MDDRRRFSAFVAKGQDPRSAILQATQFAREFLVGRNLDARTEVKVAIIVEELVANVLRHGGTGRDLSLWLLLVEEEGAIRLELEDDGSPFDPLAMGRFSGPDPVTGGGIGLAFVRAWGEDIAYRRVGERNRLELRIA
jgi:signal transduction histidine kinase